MGQILRYRRLSDERRLIDGNGFLPNSVDGYRNFASLTVGPDGTLTGLERGISAMAPAGAGESERVPAITLRSSPHKSGSAVTPWQDLFRPDRGYVYYWGDAKANQGVSPHEVPGNRTLLNLITMHQSPDRSVRELCPPLVLFRTEAVGGRTKGFVSFQGVAVVESADLMVQTDVKSGRSFANYRFGLAVLNLADDNECFDWAWINDRRSPRTQLARLNDQAPTSWRAWIRQGHEGLSLLRRRVADNQIVPKRDQLPSKGSALEKLLDKIHAHYAYSSETFEALAEFVTHHIVSREGARYTKGWLTRRAGDGGTDFVGRIDLGVGFATTRLVVLGQAKCVAPGTVTSGRDIARVVARLKRGYVGAFVTTGYFGRYVQREVVEDSYPLIMISGLQLAESLQELMFEAGFVDVDAYLSAHVDPMYAARVRDRDPDEILLDP